MADPYTTEANLIKASDRETLIKLTADNNEGKIVTEVITWAISRADNIIDAHCRGRYPADMSTANIPELIVDISTTLSLFELYKKRLTLTLPESLNKSYKLAIKMLENIQSGKLTPWESTDEPTILLSNKTSSSKTFDSDLWDTYDR
ncbi:MAG: DUF1320 domain-containing protein [Phycisphaerae bacterium]|nr:DUF1320 domain-containing protein [Phycisphaerae bacterium]NIP56330.1 DUF1320 domain-containing protein [Phycisphaerae bacterium]NIS54288.1 DUF1320 domain-containing protein [Phycisphaerae bacterium]NIX29853.1 DUF1320 domain-containing protein [Phycisphaerae bacterium]